MSEWQDQAELFNGYDMDVDGHNTDNDVEGCTVASCSCLSDDTWHRRLLAVRAPSERHYPEMALPLQDGLISSEDELTSLSDLEAKLTAQTEAGRLPSSCTITIGDWTAARFNQRYLCTVRLPTGVVKTHGKSLREAYDEARANYDTTILDVYDLSDMIDGDDVDSCSSSDCDNPTEMLPRTDLKSKHNMRDRPNGSPQPQLDELVRDDVEHSRSRQLQACMEDLEDLRSRIRELAAKLQFPKEVHQRERVEAQQERPVDAESWARAISDVDGPCRNTRSAKRLRTG